MAERKRESSRIMPEASSGSIWEEFEQYLDKHRKISDKIKAISNI